MHILQILLLAIVQGAAELLPISSSAHVVLAARLIGFDINTKQNHEWAFLLVMLHTGTMLSVLWYFRARWRWLRQEVPALIAGTIATGIVGGALIVGIEHTFLRHADGTHGDIEETFDNLPLIASGLFAAGLIIIISGFRDQRSPARGESIGLWRSALIGAVQGMALPVRGFSRSGSTISAGMLAGIARIRAEEFSFALSVLLTPVIIVREVSKIVSEHALAKLGERSLSEVLFSGLAGMFFSCLAGLVALWVLSRWLEKQRWQWFGFYCLAAAAIVLAIHFRAFPV